MYVGQSQIKSMCCMHATIACQGRGWLHAELLHGLEELEQCEWPEQRHLLSLDGQLCAGWADLHWIAQSDADSNLWLCC